MRIVECEQLSLDWWEAKRGIPTASSFDRILTAKTRKLSASADKLICELIADLVRFEPPVDLVGGGTPQMRDGINNEPEARRWYEMECELDVRQVGLCLTDDGRFGCSPDGLVGDSGGLELKCPDLKTHVGYLLDGTLPTEYVAQVHGNLLVTGRAWWDFVSYAPGLPPLRLRVFPDDFSEALQEGLDLFWERYLKVLGVINRLGGTMGQPICPRGGLQPASVVELSVADGTPRREDDGLNL